MTEPDRERFIRAGVLDWLRRFPDLKAPHLHQSEDGTRIWLTDGTDGPVLAMVTLPVSEEEAEA